MATDSPTIPLDQISSTPPMNTVNPSPNDTSGLLGTTQNAIDYTNSLAESVTNAQNNLSNTGNSINDVMNQLLGKASDVQNINETSGLNAATKQLNDLNAQAKLLNRAAQAIPIQVQQNNANTGATDAGVAPQTTGALRENALKALSIAQQADIATANYTAARDKAQQMIDVKYQPLEQQLENLKTQYAMNKDALDAIDKKQSAALEISLQKQSQDLATKKATEQSNADLAHGWAKSAFDSNQPQLAAQIQSLDPSSPTFKKDLEALQSKINPMGSLDSQYKQMQIKELAQKISSSNSIDSLNGLMSPVTQLPDGTYDTATQEALLSKMSPSDAALIREIGNYKMDISKVTSLAGGAREALAKKVALVYPGFNMANYAANAAYVKSLASTSPSSTGAIINSANKIVNHLTTFADNVSALNKKFAFPGISSGINKIRENTLQPVNSDIQNKLAQAKTSALGVTDELGKFFKGTGVADVATLKAWESRINPYATPEQLKGTVQSAIDLMQGQLNPMIDQYKQTIGTEPPPGVFLKQDTINNLSKLKNEGYKIDIPGVSYTDKVAWQKYGGGTQDQWNTAVAQLQAAGYPLTEENILQVAQNQ